MSTKNTKKTVTIKRMVVLGKVEDSTLYYENSVYQKAKQQWKKLLKKYRTLHGIVSTESETVQLQWELISYDRVVILKASIRFCLPIKEILALETNKMYIALRAFEKAYHKSIDQYYTLARSTRGRAMEKAFNNQKLRANEVLFKKKFTEAETKDKVFYKELKDKSHALSKFY